MERFRQSLRALERELPAGLNLAIREKILRAEKNNFAFGVSVSVGGIAIGIAVLFPLAKILGAELSASGFLSYLSLFFYDTGAALPFWKELLLSIVGSLPEALIGIVAALLVLGGSARFAARQISELRLVKIT